MALARPVQPITATDDELRAALARASTLQEIDDLLGTIGDAPYPGIGAEGQRGRAGSPKRTALPEGWLDSREIGEGVGDMMRGAETENDGG